MRPRQVASQSFLAFRDRAVSRLGRRQAGRVTPGSMAYLPGIPLQMFLVQLASQIQVLARFFNQQARVPTAASPTSRAPYTPTRLP